MNSETSAVTSFRSSTALITFTVAYAVFTDQFLFAAIIPVAPFSLHDRLGIPEDRVPFWTAILLAVFGIACFASSAPWGWYSDRSTSRRIPFMIGLIMILGATLMLWFGNHIAAQAVGRVLQGISSTVVWTTGLAVLVDTVGHEHIGEYMGYIGIALNMGSLIAPLLGGVVFQRAGYNAVFGLIVAVVLVDIAMRAVMKERSNAVEPLTPTPVGILDLEAAKDTRKESIITVRPARTNTMMSVCDPCSPSSPRRLSGRTMSLPSRRPSAEASSPTVEWRESGITLTDQLPVLEEVVTKTPKDGASDQEIQKSLERYELPPIPAPQVLRVPRILRLLSSTRMVVTVWAILVLAGTFSGFQATLPLFVHSTFHWNATGGGLIFLPLSAPALFGPIVGKLQDRFGGSGRWFATAGFTILTVALVLLRFVEHNNVGQKCLLVVLLTLVGCCMPLALEPLFAEIIYGADKLDSKDREAGVVRVGSLGSYGQANALFNMAWAAGNAIGPVLAAVIRDHAGWKWMTLSLGLVSGVTAVPVLLFYGGWIGKERQKQ